MNPETLLPESENEWDFYASKSEGGRFGGKKDPWWKKHIYWPVYRFFKWHKIFHPTEMYSQVKWFIQRGRRGWADCDTWSLDDYLNRWLPDALTHLKKHKHGFPCAMFTEEEAKLHDGWYDGHEEEAQKANDAAAARWDAIMDKMIEGFRANARACEGLYESECGPYSMCRPEKMTRHEYKAQQDVLFIKRRELEERDMELFKEGMKLFAEYYNSLWD